jgi:iron complex outermembrane recepter protein
MCLRNALLATFVAAPLLALADEPAPTLETVVVTATRSEQQENRLPAPVSVITQADIEKSGATQLIQVLRAAGALQVSDLYGDGSRASVDLRGFGDSAHSSTLILVDGRRLNNPDIAPPDLNSIALKDVERIEIIQGSAGVLYGDQAVGGVINIVTRAPRQFVAFVDAGGGSYGERGFRAGLGQHWTAGSLRLSAEGRDSDNYRENNALEYRNVLAQAGFDLGSARVLLETGKVHEELQTPGPLFADEVEQDRRQSSAAFETDFSNTGTDFARATWRQPLRGTWSLDTDLTHRRSDGDFQLSFASGFSSAGTQDRELWSLHPRLTGRFDKAGRDALVTVGADGLIADYRLDSAAFGEQKNRQQQRDLYAQIVVPLSATLDLTEGVRWSRVDNEPRDGFTFTQAERYHDTQSAGELGLTWHAADGTRLFARYDQSFRFAKVDEFTNACGAANTMALDTQAGESIEAGVETDAGPLRVRASAYRQDIDDELVFDPTACFGFGANANLDSTRRDGVMAEVSLSFGPGLTLDAAAHHVDPSVSSGGLAGKAIPLVARNTGKVGVSAQLPLGLRARLEAQAIDDRPLAGDFDNTLRRLPGFAVVNAALGASVAGLRVDARVNNLLDREYAEYGAAVAANPFGSPPTPERASFFPSPERNVRITVGYSW